MALKIAIQMAPVAAIDIKIAYNLATDFATLAGHVRRGLAVCCLQSPQLTLCHQQASNNQLVAIVAGLVERGVGALCVCVQVQVQVSSGGREGSKAGDKSHTGINIASHISERRRRRWHLQ